MINKKLYLYFIVFFILIINKGNLLGQNYKIEKIIVNNLEISISNGASLRVNHGDVIQFLGKAEPNSLIILSVEDPMIQESKIVEINTDSNGNFRYPESYFEAVLTHTVSYVPYQSYYEFLFNNEFLFTLYTQDLTLQPSILDAILKSYKISEATNDEDLINIFEYTQVMQNIYSGETWSNYDRNKFDAGSEKLKEFAEDDFLTRATNVYENVAIYGWQIVVCKATGGIGCASLVLHVANDIDNYKIERAFRAGKIDKETKEYLQRLNDKNYAVISFYTSTVLGNGPILIDGILFMHTMLDENEEDLFLESAIKIMDENTGKYYVHTVWNWNYNSNNINVEVLITGEEIDDFPQLFSPNISSISGNLNTPFNFSIEYSDADNDSPDNVAVVINNNPYQLLSNDIDYWDGATFSNNSPLYFPEGQYDYYFVAQQGPYTVYAPPQGSPDFTFNVSSGGGTGDPILSVSPLALDFGNIHQNTVAIDEIDIENTGTGELEWSAQVTLGNSWLSIDPMNGIVPSGYMDNIDVTANSSDLNIGQSYPGNIRIYSNNGGGPIDVSVTVFIIDNRDIYESNDTEETAYTISLNQYIRANISPDGDQDWFQAEVTEEGELRGYIRDWGIIDNPYVRGPNNLSQVYTIHTTGPNPQYIFTLDAVPGFYKVRLRDAGGGSSNQLYTWCFEFTPDDNTPPMIFNVNPEFQTIEIGEFGNISANINDDSGVDASSVYALIQNPDENTLLTVSLYDDGSSGGDETSGDGVYTGQIQTYGLSENEYYVDIIASDLESNTGENENAAMLQLFDVPNISSISRIPTQPGAFDSIEINCTIDDQSDILIVSLFYSINSGISWNIINMESSDGNLWSGTTMPLSYPEVTYKIEAIDVYNNTGTTEELSFNIELISTPYEPTGETYSNVNETIEFFTSGSTSSLGHDLEYQFNWNDGQLSSWNSSTQSHSWAEEGYFFIRARARCQEHTNAMSNWSDSTTLIIDNTSPIVEIETNSGMDFITGQNTIILEGIAHDPDPASGLASVAINTGQSNQGTLNNWRYTVDLNDGPNFFEITATDQVGNTFSGSIVVTYTNTNPNLSWTNEEGYTNEGVDPDQGYVATSFSFRILYSDADGNPPASGYPLLHLLKDGTAISSSPFEMNEANSNPFDTGRLYSYDIDSLEVGDDYTYYFEARDINGSSALGEGTTLQNGPVVNQDKFTEIDLDLTGISEGAAEWGDCDNDGDLDFIIIGGYYDGAIRRFSKIYINEGNDTFTENTNTELEGVWQGDACWADFDNDGDLDLFITGNSDLGDISKLYFNEGNNNFIESQNTDIPGTSYSTAVSGDYDNDGDVDILLMHINSQIYRNDGNGIFSADQNAVFPVTPNSSSSSGAFGDYDNDGDLDILLTGSSNNNRASKLYNNLGNGTFDEIIINNFPQISRSSVDWGDYDNDGDLDIIISGETQGDPLYITKIYRNSSDNTFTENQNNQLNGIDAGTVKWGDYDNDGDLDILIGGLSSSGMITKIYRNDGNEIFVEDVNIDLPGVHYSSLAWGDYDNDGDLDILLTGWAGSSNYITKIYQNNIDNADTVPTAPTTLSSSAIVDSVTLSWSPSTDSETPSIALGYNVRIGSSSDTVDIFSPHSDVNTGFRKIVGLGNVQQNNSWTIKNLSSGTYYWSVQAIDHAFAGSAFAAEQSFVIGEANHAPTLSWIGVDGFVNDGVNPNTGLTDTEFTFSILYMDEDNNAPLSGYPVVHINKGGTPITDSPFTMIEDNTNPFTSGRIYVFSIDSLEEGSDYTYQFEAQDMNGADAVGEGTIEQPGPVVEEEIFPYNIAITTEPESLMIIVDNDPYIAPQIFQWLPSSDHTVGVNSQQFEGDSIRYVFDRWSDEGTQIHHITTPENNTTFTAYFNTDYFLTMHADTGGTVQPESGWQRSENEIEIYAIADNDYFFTDWIGQGDGSYTGTCSDTTITMNEPISQKANFGQLRNITISTLPESLFILVDSTQYMSPQIFKLKPDSTYTIRVNSPQFGEEGVRYLFNNWNVRGDTCHTIKITKEDSIYIASFITQYYLSVDKGFPDSIFLPIIETYGEDWYTENDSAEFWIFPDTLDTVITGNRYKQVFKGWDPPVPGYLEDANRVKILMDFPKSEVANWYNVVTTNLSLLDMEFPKEFVLFQNYPNPFNPITTIKYGIPKPSQVSIEIYNLLGQKVVTLINKKQETGYYQIEFNADRLSTGIYFYVIQAENFYDIKKMLLVK